MGGIAVSSLLLLQSEQSLFLKISVYFAKFEIANLV